MPRLYPIIDLDSLSARGLPVLEFARAVLAARPARVQLRAKNASSRETLELLRAIAPLCAARGSELFANDRPDLALLGGCAGVHVGQEDLPVQAVRRIAPALKVGVSTHSLEQLEHALAEAPDYVAFGPIFETLSKLRPDPVVGLAQLEQACARARGAGCPLVAIGGISTSNIEAVGALGAMPALIGAILPDSTGPNGLETVTERVRALDAAVRAAAGA